MIGSVDNVTEIMLDFTCSQRYFSTLNVLNTLNKFETNHKPFPRLGLFAAYRLRTDGSNFNAKEFLENGNDNCSIGNLFFNDSPFMTDCKIITGTIILRGANVKLNELLLNNMDELKQITAAVTMEQAPIKMDAIPLKSHDNVAFGIVSHCGIAVYLQQRLASYEF